MGRNKQKLRFYAIEEEAGYPIDRLLQEAYQDMARYIEDSGFSTITTFNRYVEGRWATSEELARVLLQTKGVEQVASRVALTQSERATVVTTLADWAHAHGLNALRNYLTMPDKAFRAELAALLGFMPTVADQLIV
ncbi:MAG: hypothetical protein LUO93_06230 [Methanomicrobiales archaeon]|nr:hypothetical protein [Methanomicrobiales archaeon]